MKDAFRQIAVATLRCDAESPHIFVIPLRLMMALCFKLVYMHPWIKNYFQN